MAFTRKPARRRKARRAPAKRTYRRKRKNPQFGKKVRPTLYYRKKGWTRPKRSTFAPKKRSVRVNPKRRKRSVRRNPAFNVKRFMNQRFIMQTAMTGIGIGSGFLMIPTLKRLLPSAMTTGNAGKFLGAYNILAGVVIMAAMRRNRGAQTIGTLIAGVGAYDLIASNVPQLGFPKVPRGATGFLADMLPAGVTADDDDTAPAGDVSASYAVARRPVSPVAQSQASLAANYGVPAQYGYGTKNALAASYSAPGFDVSGFNGDSGMMSDMCQ